MYDPTLSDYAASLTKELFVETFGYSKEQLRSMSGKMTLYWNNQIHGYHERRANDLRTIPSLYQQGDHVDVLGSFHHMKLEDSQGNQFTDQDLVGLCKERKSFAIEAQAGYGKSFLLRKLFLDGFSGKKNTPQAVFIELRDINKVSFKSIYELIAKELGLEGDAGIAIVRFGLDKKYFTLFFDAFDEVQFHQRENFLEALSDLRAHFPETPVVISGRQNDYFPLWGKIPVYFIKPMTLDHLKSFIRTSSGEARRKEIFLERLTPEFYRKYQSFLSSPLLALLMLLVFSESAAQLPSTQHDFFSRAYSALCTKLDSVKTFKNGKQYRRIFQSKLNYSDFAKVFSIFSAISYTKGKSRFDYITLEELMIKSILNSNISKQQRAADASAVITDFFEAICLFLREGSDYTYSHRSFQEYFTALYFSNSAGSKLSHFLDRTKFRINDDVLPMLLEMNREKVLLDWVKPTLEGLMSIENEALSPGENLFLKGWDSIVLAMDDDHDHFVHFEATPSGRHVLAIARMFPEFFGQHDREYRSMTRRKFSEVSPNLVNDSLAPADPRFRDAMTALDQEHKDGRAFMVKRLPLTPKDLPLLRSAGLLRSAEADFEGLRKVAAYSERALQRFDNLDSDFFD